MRTILILIAATIAGCAGEQGDRRRYESILWENEPAGRGTDSPASREALTLEVAYRMALHRSERLAIDGERLVLLQTRYEQARGSALPDLSFRGNYTRLDDSGLEQPPTSFLKERTEYRFALSQPIFDGLRAFHALRQSDALYRAVEHDLRDAKLRLYGDVARAFYAVLEAERELATTEDTLRLAAERRTELEERQKVGLSRRSEVLQQEAEVASTQARADRLRGARAVAWEVLLFLTGMDPRTKLREDPGPPPDLPPLETVVERALARRPDLKALDEEISAAEEGRGVARAGALPAVDLDADLYTHRKGSNEGSDWEVRLSFTVPLFEGGITPARIREANSAVRSARLALEERRREARLDVARAHAEADSLRSETASLEKAVASAQENYELVLAEYRGGIVPNLEVLASFDTLQQARLERDRARYRWKIATVALAIACGVLPGDPNP